jgi:hypothetical protein
MRDVDRDPAIVGAGSYLIGVAMGLGIYSP